MIKCSLCGENTILKVAEQGGVNMYSCANEKCINYTELLVEVNGILVLVDELMRAYTQIVKDIQNEEDSISED